MIVNVLNDKNYYYYYVKYNIRVLYCIFSIYEDNLILIFFKDSYGKIYFIYVYLLLLWIRINFWFVVEMKCIF